MKYLDMSFVSVDCFYLFSFTLTDSFFIVSMASHYLAVDDVDKTQTSLPEVILPPVICMYHSCSIPPRSNGLYCKNHTCNVSRCLYAGQENQQGEIVCRYHNARRCETIRCVRCGFCVFERILLKECPLCLTPDGMKECFDLHSDKEICYCIRHNHLRNRRIEALAKSVYVNEGQWIQKSPEEILLEDAGGECSLFDRG